MGMPMEIRIIVTKKLMIVLNGEKVEVGLLVSANNKSNMIWASSLVTLTTINYREQFWKHPMKKLTVLSEIKFVAFQFDMDNQMKLIRFINISQ